uniref:MFS transporter n=1 Tax=Candidatus Aschnera chinzeii TaxID=1485666 RepID=A0AAT9G4G9_9ENTR|nr:MAG: MFS transporter [Candidatus Aschnera chinzeii]
MTSQELKITFGLGIVFTIRIFGIFMILPIITIYGKQLPDANNFLVGIAIGIYGITQVIFQIPYGLMSDKFNRKTIIIIGLIIYLLGSTIATVVHSIWGIIIGRALQGTSAISSTIMALLSDLTSEENMSKAVALIGISFGITFIIAIVAGPIIGNIVGLHGMYGIISITTLLGIIVAYITIPSHHTISVNYETNFVKQQIKKIINNYQLIKFNIGIFFLHTILMLNFIVIPFIMINANIAIYNHWKIYLITLLISFIIVMPIIIYTEKYKIIKKILLIFTGIIAISEIFLFFSNHRISLLCVGIQLFFIAFNVMEVLLPSLSARTAPLGCKGTAMSIYSISQFLGVSLGGGLGGICLDLYNNIELICFISFLLSICWILINYTISPITYCNNIRISISHNTNDFLDLQKKLINLNGVKDVLLDRKNYYAYLKIDKNITNIKIINNFIKHQ